VLKYIKLLKYILLTKVIDSFDLYNMSVKWSILFTPIGKWKTEVHRGWVTFSCSCKQQVGQWEKIGAVSLSPL
jgi:hypothetical protein